MSANSFAGDDHSITVIPYCPHCSGHYRKPVTIYTLCFWFNNKVNHAVTGDTIQPFVVQAKLLGATIYPDYPELGCYAVDNNDQFFSPAGKTRVREIHYQGQVIYRDTDCIIQPKTHDNDQPALP